MTDLKNYEIESPSGGTMTVQLSEADAKARGLTVKKAAEPSNKARKGASNKSAK